MTNDVAAELPEGPSSGLIAFRRISEIQAKPITWLWPGRIPSKLTVLAGQPGLGKSQLTIAMAATISTGSNWPDNSSCELGSTIFICSEDDASDTIKPRLQAAGANEAKVVVVDAKVDKSGKKSQWLLDNGIEGLESLCIELGDVKLIVIDPITAYLGNKDGHSTSDVRGLLAPLTDLADRLNIAIIIVSHLNKSTSTDAVSRVTGSVAFVAASRASFVVGKHPEIENALCLATIKTNLSQDKTGIGYQIVSTATEEGISTSRIEWIPGSIEIDADALLDPKRSTSETKKFSASNEAKSFLIELLSNGRVPSTEVVKKAAMKGLSESTLKRAKAALPISSKKDGEMWFWEIDDQQEDQ